MGFWGTLSLGLLASGEFGLPTPEGADNSTVIEGLFYGGGTGQLRAQLIGSITCVVVVFSVAMALMFAIRKIPGAWNLRIGKEEELEGIDISEHGLPAYHMEFGQGVSYSTYTGADPDGLDLSKAAAGSVRTPESSSS